MPPKEDTGPYTTAQRREVTEESKLGDHLSASLSRLRLYTRATQSFSVPANYRLQKPLELYLCFTRCVDDTFPKRDELSPVLAPLRDLSERPVIHSLVLTAADRRSSVNSGNLGDEL